MTLHTNGKQPSILTYPNNRNKLIFLEKLLKTSHTSFFFSTVPVDHTPSFNDHINLKISKASKEIRISKNHLREAFKKLLYLRTGFSLTFQK